MDKIKVTQEQAEALDAYFHKLRIIGTCSILLNELHDKTKAESDADDSVQNAFD